MTPREWNHVLDHKVEWSIAYPAVAREVQRFLSVWPYPGITTNGLVESLYPEAAARGDGIYARRRIFTALDALREHELADWCHQEEPTRARFGKMIRRVRWHQPQAVTEAEEVQTPEPSPARSLDAMLAALPPRPSITLDAFLAELPPERRATIEARLQELLRAELATVGLTQA